MNYYFLSGSLIAKSTSKISYLSYDFLQFHYLTTLRNPQATESSPNLEYLHLPHQRQFLYKIFQHW